LAEKRESVTKLTEENDKLKYRVTHLVRHVKGEA
jgi:hypothetical protein